jgi:hypothetical protein
MPKINKYLRYVGAFLLFMISYTLVAILARIFISVVNYDVGGWARDYFLPYFISAMAGGFGTAMALGAVESIFPLVRLRPVVWAFIVLLCLMWGFALFGIAIGAPIIKGVTAEITQAIVAAITGWKLTQPSRKGGIKG